MASVGDTDPDLFAGSGIFTVRSGSGSGSSSIDVYLPSNCFQKDFLNQFLKNRHDLDTMLKFNYTLCKWN